MYVLESVPEKLLSQYKPGPFHRFGLSLIMHEVIFSVALEALKPIGPHNYKPSEEIRMTKQDWIQIQAHQRLLPKSQ